MIHGSGNFSGGVTTLRKIGADASVVLEKADGFTVESGALVPDKLVGDLMVGSPLAETLAEQTPFAYASNSTVKVIARDKDALVREFSAGNWSSAGDELPILAESTPFRIGKQVVFPTTGGLMCYEPASPSTKLRPLSFKSPLDYNENAKPAVTPTASGELQLWDNGDANAWTAVGTGCSASTTDGVTTFMIGATTPAATKLFTKSLGSTGVLLTGKQYLVVDMLLSGDSSTYTYAGLFPNDASLYPSGYELYLYSDEACTSLIRAIRIPKLTPDGQVIRVAFSIPASTSTVKGVAIWSAPFFTAPEAGSSYTLKVYSEVFADGWSHKGNFLMPGISYAKSPIAEAFADATAVGGAGSEFPPNNLVTNPSFENSTTDWTFSAGASLMTRDPHSGISNANIDNTGEYIRHDNVPVTANLEYACEFWARTNNTGGQIHMEITPDSGSMVRYPDTGSIKPDSKYTRHTKRFTAPASATKVSVKIIMDSGSSSNDVALDDISVYLVDQTSAGSTYIIQTFDEAGTGRTPADPKVRYSYCFLGRNTLGEPLYKHMVSNPSLESSPDTYCDPWRTFTVDIALPGTAGSQVTDEYGNYVTHALIYRQIYNGDLGIWSAWEFIQAVPIASTMQYIDGGNDGTHYINGVEVPFEREVYNDYASPARYGMVSEGRVYAGCLDWDGSAWRRPTAIEVSSYDKVWAYPTTNDDDSLVTDGTELDGYAVTGSELRGIAARNDERYVWLDNEMFLLRGDNPQTGWRFIRIGAVGCISNRSIADCRTAIIWHDGNHFFALAGGGLQPISRFKIDSTKIDWTKPHNAVFCNDRYIFFCKYDGKWSLLQCDINTFAWTIRQSDALELAGIATTGAGGVVYGLTPDGHVVDLYNSLSVDYGADAVVRTASTQYIVVGGPNADAQIKTGIIEVITASPVTIALTYRTFGKLNETQTATVNATSTKTRYEVNLNIKGNAVQIEAVVTGACPDIYYLGVETDEASAQ